MRIIKRSDINHVDKPEGTKVDYYLFDDFELHYNEQAPRTTQAWHRHEQIEESLLVISGELMVRWQEGDEERAEILEAGDYVETQRSMHTFENLSDEKVIFVVIKRMATNQNYREIFRTDKIID